MKILELINQDNITNEMPVSTYKTIGDFTKTGPFTGIDKKLVPHQKNIEKTTNFFEKNPYNFKFFFSNIPGTGKYSEYGTITPDELRKIFKKDAEEIILGSQNSITVVFVGNTGADKKILSPWMIGHRFGHSIQAGTIREGNAAWKKTEDHFFKSINTILREYYGRNVKSMYSSNVNWELSSTYSALFNAIGTQRSSRTGQIKRPYEFLYELFTQYLQSGQVKLNPLPVSLSYGKKAWGRSMQSMRLQPEYADEYTQAEATDRLANQLNQLFDSVLSDSVGKIYLM